MDVKLVLLMNCFALVYCQSTISTRNDAEWQNEFFGDVISELESIRHLLRTQQKTDVSNERQAIQQLKSEIQDIRQNLHEIGNRKKNCPPGFDYLPEAGSCYRVIFERINWDNATERCRQVMPGVHLAAITSQQESDAITRYLHSHFSGGNNRCTQFTTPWPEAGNMIWIGGQTKNSLCTDPYVWKPLKGIEIPVNYTNWAPNYPDCFQDSENCLQIATGLNYKWNDLNCAWSSCAICELQM